LPAHSANLTAVAQGDKRRVTFDAKLLDQVRLVIAVDGADLISLRGKFTDHRLHHAAVAAPIGLEVEQDGFGTSAAVGQTIEHNKSARHRRRSSEPAHLISLPGTPAPLLFMADNP
jgi:hypothetical protein